MLTTASLEPLEPLSAEQVIITGELERRPARRSDHAAENRILQQLAHALANQPESMLQLLVEGARELCRADSAGVSLLDPDRVGSDARFRWVATAGAFGPLKGATLPRYFSPCGSVLDTNQTLLMSDPERSFPYIADLPDPVHEVLLVPFYRGQEAVGTVWVATHTRERKFDCEDSRVVSSLANFAASGVQLLETIQNNQVLQEKTRAKTEHEVGVLTEENRRIAAMILEKESDQQIIKRELQDTQLLADVAARLIPDDESQALYEEILEAALRVAEADAGTIQLLDATDHLTFLATRGFSAWQVDHFASVSASSGSPCGVALSRGERIFMRFDTPGAPDPDGALKIHLDGGIAHAQSTPLWSRSGVPIGMLSTHWAKDYTLSDRQIRLLDVLGRQAADLIERKQVSDKLRARERELQDADRRKDEFLAVLAHELRNPLVPIRNGVALLKNVQRQPELIDKLQPMMERQVDHMVRLIDDLLDVSRITSGKVALQRKPVSLSSLIHSAVEANRDATAAAGLELVIDLKHPDRVIEVDATRLSQVISNILHNATKFTPKGGRIMVRAEFTPKAHQVPEQLHLRISDSGVGIATHMLPAVFELFTQVDPNSSVRYGGLGIGLALARTFVELHGGTIEAISGGIGLGSEFFIKIPVTSHDSGQADPTDSALTLNAILSGLRVLVVDDNRDAADSIGLLISQSGAEVRVNYDGQSALSTLETFNASLVLLDLGMANVDGYETCQRIRQQGGEHLSVVAVTGWGQDDDRRRTSAAGFDGHLTKPVSPDQLVALAHAVRALQ